MPEVLAVDHDCLILGWIEPGKPTADAAAAFGRALAATHAAGARRSALDHDGYIGRLPLPNKPRRHLGGVLRRPAGSCRTSSSPATAAPITADEAAAVESVVGRLADLVPEEPPARLHGDLWNGNVLWGQDGRVWVIDPAAHGGHRETDLAMLALFGLPHLPRVLDGLRRGRPARRRLGGAARLHQLFPLLVHAALFGGGYGARAAQTARRYA